MAYTPCQLRINGGHDEGCSAKVQLLLPSHLLVTLVPAS